MAPQARIGGTIAVKINGEIQYAKGNFSYNLGKNLKKGIAGADRVHGFTETPQVPFIEGELTFHSDMSLTDLVELQDATVSIDLANNKTIVLREAWYAGEGTGNSEEGNVAVRFEGKDAEEI